MSFYFPPSLLTPAPFLSIISPPLCPGSGLQPMDGTGTNRLPSSPLSPSHPNYTHHPSNASIGPNPAAFPPPTPRGPGQPHKIAMDLDPMNKREWQVSWGHNAQCQMHTVFLCVQHLAFVVVKKTKNRCHWLCNMRPMPAKETWIQHKKMSQLNFKKDTVYTACNHMWTCPEH